MMVIVIFVIMTFVIVGVFGAVVRLGLIRLWFLFNCAGRAQSFCLPCAVCAENDARIGDKLPVSVRKTAFKAASNRYFGRLAATGFRCGHTTPTRMGEIPSFMV